MLQSFCTWTGRLSPLDLEFFLSLSFHNAIVEPTWIFGNRFLSLFLYMLSPSYHGGVLFTFSEDRLASFVFDFS